VLKVTVNVAERLEFQEVDLVADVPASITNCPGPIIHLFVTAVI
jgi:hypothetical protein